MRVVAAVRQRIPTTANARALVAKCNERRVDRELGALFAGSLSRVDRSLELTCSICSSREVRHPVTSALLIEMCYIEGRSKGGRVLYGFRPVSGYACIRCERVIGTDAAIGLKEGLAIGRSESIQCDFLKGTGFLPVSSCRSSLTSPRSLIIRTNPLTPTASR
jgi:hypothetical protein